MLLTVILISAALLILSMAGLGIRLLFKRDARLSGTCCSTSADKAEGNEFSCCCGGACDPGTKRPA